MPTKVEQKEKSVLQVARELNRYSPDAFDFLREALDHSVRSRHGAAGKASRRLLDWIEENGVQPSQLAASISEGEVPKSILRLIAELGGLEATLQKLNLHVSGEELCAGIRDLALERWGLMASTVLRTWGIQSTMDLGRMVFALVDNGILQKQPHDSIEDFRDVYDFDIAFDKSYRIDLRKMSIPPRKTEDAIP